MINTCLSELIGDTPLLKLCVTENGSCVLLKLEQFNPTGTAKIRMARQMLDEAQASGQLKPGGRIVESTSGNTGPSTCFTTTSNWTACPASSVA